jgi:hypothetical protein
VKLLDHKLYLTIGDLIACGVSEKYLWTARSKGIKSIRFIDDPEDNRRVLIEYDALSQKYKDLIFTRYGNPYDHVTFLSV